MPSFKAPARKWYIYTLSDPRKKEIRYVGLSSIPKTRLSLHLTASKTGKGGNKEKDIWLQSLVSEGISPNLTIIDSGTGVYSRLREKKWIRYYKRQGCDLFNLNGFGSFVTKDKTFSMSLKTSPETFRKIRFVCADLDISRPEFLRRAVARELAYNERRLNK